MGIPYVSLEKSLGAADKVHIGRATRAPMVSGKCISGHSQVYFVSKCSKEVVSGLHMLVCSAKSPGIRSVVRVGPSAVPENSLGRK